MRQIRFPLERQPISEADTPAQLEIENEDKMGVFQQQQQQQQVSTKEGTRYFTPELSSYRPKIHSLLNKTKTKNVIWFPHILTAA